MFDILTNFELSKKISIDKLGITFRKLSKKEKESILNDIDKYYTKNKQSINMYIKKYNYDEDLKLNIELLKYDNITRETIMLCFLGKKQGFKFNSINQINKILNNMIIIDIKKDVFLEYVEEKNIKKIISNILSLYDIYSSDIKFNKNVRMDYSFILDQSILNSKDENHYQYLITNIIMSYKSTMVKNTELSEDFLVKISEFFSKLNKIEIRRFLWILDMFYSSSSMIQNNVINNITISESILIKEGEDIKSSYILKAGLILKHYASGKTTTVNKFIHDYLSYCYDIRSAVVHGNEEKILDSYNSFIQKNKEFNSLVKDKELNYCDKKNNAMGMAYMMSSIVNRAIIKYWLDYPSNISYIKN